MACFYGKLGTLHEGGPAFDESGWALAVTWSDVGGYDDVKSRLRQALEWPVKHTAAFKRLGLLAPRGILLHGPPGELTPRSTVSPYKTPASPHSLQWHSPP